jgi:hypothetical protein
VSAVEAADANVEDARDERRSVVLWHGHAASANRAEVRVRIGIGAVTVVTV